MAESFTSYSVDNDRIFRRALDSAANQVEDLRLPFGQISADFYRSQQAIFKLKGPGQYPDFKSPSYKEFKKRKYGFQYPLLVATGKLAASVLGPNNPGSVNIIEKKFLVLGTSIEYGIYHQSDKPRSVIPLRKFLFIGPEAKQFATSEQVGRLNRWVGYINDYVANVAIRNGIASKLKPSGGVA